MNTTSPMQIIKRLFDLECESLTHCYVAMCDINGHHISCDDGEFSMNGKARRRSEIEGHLIMTSGQESTYA